MKKGIHQGLCAFLLLLLACQREISFEALQKSAGSLGKDASGNCELITAGGSYTAARPLNDSNFLTVNVHVTAPGSYLISTDTVNGYYFFAAGNFAAAGNTTVTLKAGGTPLAAGVNNFTVRYDSSRCAVALTVERSLSDPAAFSLTGAPGTCVNASVQGSFVKGYPLDTSKVLLQVTVTVPGRYTIGTGTVNGYSFSGSGVFTATGTQTVALAANGTPAAAGTDAFSVTGAPAGCTFAVPVVAPLAITGTDYFPLSYPSFWTYSRNDFTANDSVKRTVVDSLVQNGQLYKKMDEYFPFAGGPLYFRKAGADYFEYVRVDKYTTSFQYGTAVNGDIPFLKENLTTGATWLSPEYTGTASFGQTILLRYRFQCVDAAAAVTVNGLTFGNVYKIRMLPEIASVGNAWGSTNEAYEFDYAKGVGLVFGTKVLNGYTQYRQALRRWMVY